jgi:MFS family permease
MFVLLICHHLNFHLQFFILYCFQVFGGSGSKKYGGKALLSLSVLLWSFSTLMVPFCAPSINWLIFSRVLLGLGEGLGNLYFIMCYKYLYMSKQR